MDFLVNMLGTVAKLCKLTYDIARLYQVKPKHGFDLRNIGVRIWKLSGWLVTGLPIFRPLKSILNPRRAGAPKLPWSAGGDGV